MHIMRFFLVTQTLVSLFTSCTATAESMTIMTTSANAATAKMDSAINPNPTCGFRKNANQCQNLMSNFDVGMTPNTIYSQCTLSGCFNFCNRQLVSCEADFDSTADCPFDYVAGCVLGDRPGGMVNGSGGDGVTDPTSVIGTGSTAAATTINPNPQCGIRKNGHLCKARMQQSIVGVFIDGDRFPLCVETGCFNFGCNANNFLHCQTNFEKSPLCENPVSGCTLADLEEGGDGGGTIPNEVTSGTIADIAAMGITTNCGNRKNGNFCAARMKSLDGITISADKFGTCKQTGCFSFGCNANNFFTCDAPFFGTEICTNYVSGCTTRDWPGESAVGTGVSITLPQGANALQNGLGLIGGLTVYSLRTESNLIPLQPQCPGQINGQLCAARMATLNTVLFAEANFGMCAGAAAGCFEFGCQGEFLGCSKSPFDWFNVCPTQYVSGCRIGEFVATSSVPGEVTTVSLASGWNFITENFAAGQAQCPNRNRPDLCRERMEAMYNQNIPRSDFEKCAETGCFQFGCNNGNFLNCESNFQGTPICANYVAGCRISDLFATTDSNAIGPAAAPIAPVSPVAPVAPIAPVATNSLQQFPTVTVAASTGTGTANIQASSTCTGKGCGKGKMKRTATTSASQRAATTTSTASRKSYKSIATVTGAGLSLLALA